MALKPWRSVVDPREDLRKGESLDAAEFAVHLDEVYEGRGNELYYKPAEFFARTYLTRHLLELSAEVVRRLSGIKTATSAVYNMTTQFGGGKTHALTLLYHLAEHGPDALSWPGVASIRQQAQVSALPKAKTAVFVGHRFDPRGGNDGSPLRQTPWGEIAWQLAGAEGYAVMATADSEQRAPGGDTIQRLFALVDQPILILMDEVINYISRNRQSGLGGQLYNFVQNLSEEARSHEDVVVAISIPKSEEEMTAEDVDDYRRFSKMLNRLGQAVMMSADSDTAEIIRRRLFEWDARAIDQQGRVILPREAIDTCQAYAAWVQTYRGSLPGDFAADNALDEFKATYPFHPALISVFRRKWQGLPSFQRTRGVLRLLAMWVSKVHEDAYKSAHQDPLIGLGTAPLDDSWFRSAVFKQLGNDELEAAVTTDIAGTKNAHAVHLDADTTSEAIRRARLHRKVATAIFFESNGGQTKDYATIPEIRFAVGEPDLDISNVETALEALAPPDGACFYLDSRGTHYLFSMVPNLTKVFSDRKASLSGDPRIEEAVRAEIQRQFGTASGVSRVFFPEQSGDIPNQPVLTVAVLPPEQSSHDKDAAYRQIQKMTLEHGNSARTYKSAVIWAMADSAAPLYDAAHKLLAWETMWDERANYQLGESQEDQLNKNRLGAQSILKEAVWRVYNKVVLLGKDNSLREVDLGRQNSSSAPNLLMLIVRELRKFDDIVTDISPNFLVRNWPPAFTEWSTKSVRDAFYASPQFPRLADPAAIKETIAKGVSNGMLGYVGKAADGGYEPFYFNEHLGAADVEITDDMYIVSKETAVAYSKKTDQVLKAIVIAPSQATALPRGQQSFAVQGYDDKGQTMPVKGVAWSTEGGTISADGVFTAGDAQGRFTITATADGLQATATIAVDDHVPPPPPPPPPPQITRLIWSGDIPPQKWVNYYMKVLTKFASNNEMTLSLQVEIRNSGGISEHQVEEMKAALRELGLEARVSAS